MTSNVELSPYFAARAQANEVILKGKSRERTASAY